MARSLKVKTKVRAGDLQNKVKCNHNPTLTRGLKVRSGVKAGIASPILF